MPDLGVARPLQLRVGQRGAKEAVVAPWQRYVEMGGEVEDVGEAFSLAVVAVLIPAVPR